MKAKNTLKSIITAIFFMVMAIAVTSIYSTITVNAASNVTKFKRNGKMTMIAGEKKKINFIGYSTKDYSLEETNLVTYYKWTSSNEDIVSIYSYNKGKLRDRYFQMTAKKSGTVTITGMPNGVSGGAQEMTVTVTGKAPTAKQKKCKHAWKKTKQAGVKKCKKCKLIKDTNIPYELQEPDVESIKVTCDDNGKVTLCWVGNKEDSGYEIYRATSKKGQYSLVETIKADTPDNMQFIDEDAVGTDREPHELRFYRIRTYTEKNGEKEFSSYSTVVGTPISKEMKHHYRVRFISQPFTGYACAYIETDNKEKCSTIGGSVLLETFEIKFYDKNGAEAGFYDKTTGKTVQSVKTVSSVFNRIDNVNYTEDGEKVMVEDGYLLVFYFLEPGQYTAKVTETLMVDRKGDEIKTEEMVLGTVDVRDYKAENEAWMQEIIDGTAEPGMSKKEHMSAIARKLSSISKYTKNNSKGYLYFLEDVNVPYFIQREWNSYDTPILLVDFGERIDYPLKSLYNKYRTGTDEWRRYHYFAYSAEDDAYFSCVNPTDSNFYKEIPMFDFKNYTGYYDCQPTAQM